jgi:hypothetical protein
MGIHPKHIILAVFAENNHLISHKPWTWYLKLKKTIGKPIKITENTINYPHFTELCDD